MKLRLLIAICVLLAPASVFAGEKRDVPKELFGIKLGGIYTLTNLEDDKSIGNFPIKKIAGVQTFMGQVIHIYFQPQNEYDIFEYIEKKEKPEDQYSETSFRIVAFPIIPENLTKFEDLDKLGQMSLEVAYIEWSKRAETTEVAYFWALDLCKTFGVDISVEPEIYHEYELKIYACTFRSGDREFRVDNMDTLQQVNLSFTREVFEAKDKALEEKRRKLHVEEIRPYK